MKRPLIRLSELSELDLTASHGIFIKRPNNERRTFSIIPYVRRNGKKCYEMPLNIQELNELNEFLRENKITPINADRQITNIKKQINEHIKSLSVDTSLGLNLEIAERFLKKKEAQSKNRSTSDSSYRSSMFQAVRLLGKKSLISDTIMSLQIEFDKNFEGSVQLHKNLVNRVNTLLRKEVGRTDALVGMKGDSRLIRHISIKELHILLSKIEHRDMRTLIAIGGHCGLRMGEIFGLTKKALISDDVIYVSRQKLSRPDKKTGETYTLPKAYKKRKTIIITGGKKYVDEFLQNGPAHYEQYRDEAATYLREKCEQLWPNDTERQLEDFHDLRDVFAVHLVSSGVPIDTVAKMMGNSPAVCLANYQGFIASDKEVDLARSILSK